jgi:hypothetical protein
VVAASLSLPGDPPDTSVETLLRALVEAVARMTGAGAVLVTVDAEDGLERLAAAEADGCVRQTLARPDVLDPLVRQLRALGRPVGPDDLEGTQRELLDAVAPQGFVALPVGRGVRGVLTLVEPDAAPVLDATTVGLAAVLAMLSGEALASVRRASALRDTCEDLRGLAADVLARRDRECEETAHELHESICQDLAGASAELQAAEHLLEIVPEARTRVRDARRLVSSTIGDLREVAQRLRPAMLHNLGYVQALRWYAGRLRERTGVALRLEVEGEDHRLPLDMESALYRATEDALASAACRRADLRVSYRQQPEAVQLEIAGTTPGAIELAAMRERLRPFRGTVRVTTPPGAPPVLALSLPLN